MILNIKQFLWKDELLMGEKIIVGENEEQKQLRFGQLDTNEAKHMAISWNGVMGMRFACFI